MEKLFVIKIGGNIIDDDAALSAFLKKFSQIAGKKILVHGGGKLATRLAGELGIQQQLVEGRRITDAETLKIVTMVYAGYINKNIVAGLQENGCNAVGICGADGNAILAHKRTGGAIDYGFAGDIDAVNTAFITGQLQLAPALVVAPITHNGQGQLLNTNADTIAQELATSLSNAFDVTLIFSFEKAGVLRNTEDDGSVIPTINAASYKQLKEEQVIFAGMIPKLDNAFAAIRRGVKEVIIGKAEKLEEVIAGRSGTVIH